jgi:hypothetical protein
VVIGMYASFHRIALAGSIKNKGPDHTRVGSGRQGQ